MIVQVDAIGRAAAGHELAWRFTLALQGRADVQRGVRRLRVLLAARLNGTFEVSEGDIRGVIQENEAELQRRAARASGGWSASPAASCR